MVLLDAKLYLNGSGRMGKKHVVMQGKVVPWRSAHEVRVTTNFFGGVKTNWIRDYPTSGLAGFRFSWIRVSLLVDTR